ncbi:hypothetical protein ACE6H2_015876 [Prunus campanulata]
MRDREEKHGEVFVLNDGGEVDLDLGNYERFLDVTLTRDNNITIGKIYEVVPHITNAIKTWIELVSLIPVDGKEGPADVCVIKLGGTVGDIESLPFNSAPIVFFSWARKLLSYSCEPDSGTGCCWRASKTLYLFVECYVSSLSG